MASQTETQEKSQAIQDAILEAGKTARALKKRAMDFSATEVMMLAVGPVLDALGWDSRDPRQVRHVDGTTTVLQDKNSPVVAIRSLGLDQQIADEAPDDASAEWVIVTNGIEWKSFRGGAGKSKPVAMANLDTVSSTRETLGTMMPLRKDRFSQGNVDKAWRPEAIDEAITNVVATFLRSADDMIDFVRGRLGDDADIFGENAIKAGLARLKAKVGTEEIEGVDVSGLDAQANPAPKTRTAKSKAAARKTTASKGSTTKGTSRKATAEPAAAQPSDKSVDPKGAHSRQDAAKSVEWPQEATHLMKRRSTVAFVKYDDSSGSITILPGSRISAKTGQTATAKQKEQRSRSIEDGSLRRAGDTLEVTTPMQFDSARLAASFAAGALVKEPTAFVDREGSPIGEKAMSSPRGGKAAKPAGKPAERKEAARSGELELEPAE